MLNRIQRKSVCAVFHLKRKVLFMSDNIPSEKPPILTDTYGLKAPKAARAGVGARTLAEIKEATETRPRPGDYYDSNSDKR
jgi:hypothetical protein